jgi:signal transduction histidine kinase/ActR/RegA family two-component response regulator
LSKDRKQRYRRPSRRRPNDPLPVERTDEAQVRAGPFAGLKDTLLDKYGQLSSKYDTLVKKYESASIEDIGVYRLGWWALRTSASALALVRRGAVVLTNHRWEELESGQSGERRWELLAADGPQPTYDSLHHLAVETGADLLARPDMASSVTRYRRATGEQVVEVRTERIPSARDMVALLVHDVTAQARAETELETAREALHRRHRMEAVGELASGVAHDLNNALNVMRLRLDLLGRELTDGGHGAHLKALSGIVDDAAARVARVHDLSRRQTDEPLEPIQLQVAIAEALALARTELEQHALVEGRHFRLVSRIPELPPVRANGPELKHLFVNLLLNARDAMPHGGTVSIEARREEDFAVVTVADEGTGIAAEHLERVFEAFFTTKKNGTGLGLSMARGAISRLGGSIVARNRPTLGAEFVLRIPLAVHEPPPVPRPDPAPPIAVNGSLRVLLVDDDHDCLEVTQAVLEAEGLTVATAPSGADALRRLHAQPYDLLLCDVGMPEMSGWQVAQEARAQWPAMPIFMVTGWGTELASASSRPTIVDGVLAKPLDVGELRSAIRSASERACQSGTR